MEKWSGLLELTDVRNSAIIYGPFMSWAWPTSGADKRREWRGRVSLRLLLPQGIFLRVWYIGYVTNALYTFVTYVY